MIPDTQFNIWEHSQNVKKLYAARCHGEAEMDAVAQAAELLAPILKKAAQRGRAARLLDAGAGSGYLWHSFKKRRLPVDYYALDYSPSLIDIGREILPQYGLPAERLMVGAIEDLSGQHFDIVCLINTLTFCPDFRAPLDRLAATGASTFLIRDNFGDDKVIRWEPDGYLDDGYNHLKAYWNQWSKKEVAEFLERDGWGCLFLPDRRTNGQVEMVVDKPYYWHWLLAARHMEDMAETEEERDSDSIRKSSCPADVELPKHCRLGQCLKKMKAALVRKK